MGWLYTRHQTKDQLIAMLMQPRGNEAASSEVLEYHLAGNNLWSLVRLTAKQDDWNQLKRGESMVFIRLDLLDHSDDGWGYKCLEESMTPFHHNRPLHYLDLAQVQSAEWREGVREFHANEAQKNVVRQMGASHPR